MMMLQELELDEDNAKCICCDLGNHYSYGEIKFKGFSFCRYCFMDKELVMEMCGLEENEKITQEYLKLREKLI